MRPFLKGASAIVLVAVLLTTTFCIIPDESDASGVDPKDGMYGRTLSVNSTEIGDAIQTATGKTFDQWVAELSDKMENYDINKLEPVFDFKMSMRRDVYVDGTDYTAVDRYAGYLTLLLDSDISGHFPAEGTYDAKEKETSLGFLLRVFSKEGAANITDTQQHIDLKIYFDVTVETQIDLNTNDITYSYITLKVAMEDHEHNNINIVLHQNEEGRIVSMDISYEESAVDNTFYLNAEVGMDITGMHMHMAEAEWYTEPLAVTHVYKSVVSSDLANGVWGIALEAMGDNTGSIGLPNLIIKLLGSGSRMLDLFDTIRSLTSSEIPDIGITCGFMAKDYNDGTYDYCRLSTISDDPAIVDIPWGGYNLDLCQLVKNIPESMLPGTHEEIVAGKAVTVLIMAALGLDHIEVGDISEDVTKQNECALIETEVDSMIESFEVTSYHTPDTYIWLATGISAITIVVILVMWRLRP